MLSRNAQRPATGVARCPPVVYLGMDGPHRETAAEARMFRSWGADVIGQNLVPEIALAAELSIPYAGLVTVTEYSADRTIRPIPGVVRTGLEQTNRALPTFLHHLAHAAAIT